MGMEESGRYRAAALPSDVWFLPPLPLIRTTPYFPGEGSLPTIFGLVGCAAAEAARTNSSASQIPPHEEGWHAVDINAQKRGGGRSHWRANRENMQPILEGRTPIPGCEQVVQPE